MRKFGYSEHCVYTGAMLSFICILFWFLEIQFWERKFLVLISGDSILGTKVSGFDFWRFILGAKVSVLISGNLHLERHFIWVSGRV